jgi:DNA-binding Xre family transcriptional regulator
MGKERESRGTEWSGLIVSYMQKRQMTVADLSKASGISKASIYELLNGNTRTLNSATLIAYIKALEIPTEEISEFLDNM